ncbi:hypothetical protein MRB53_037899 [Persea americana]|nr:hypothetical protein MRB53_037899 [Persea americana]
MISRTILRQSRQLSSLGSSPSAVSSSLRSPRTPVLSARLPAPARARVIARWYSEASEAKTEEKTAETSAAEDKATETEDPRDKEIAAGKAEIKDLKDKYLRSVAEFRNLQERTRREVQAAKDFALQKFARDLIESVDNLDLALVNVPAEKLKSAAAEDKDLQQLHGGLKMTETVLMNTLSKHGLERFDPNGEKFDPNRHEATFQTPQEGKEDGTVFHTTQKGFLYNGRVLRGLLSEARRHICSSKLATMCMRNGTVKESAPAGSAANDAVYAFVDQQRLKSLPWTATTGAHNVP